MRSGSACDVCGGAEPWLACGRALADRCWPAAMMHVLESLRAGERLLLGGDRWVEVSPELARAFRPGDAVVAVAAGGATAELLHLPAAERSVARGAVDRALGAFQGMGSVSEAAIAAFFGGFAARLEDERIWTEIRRVNEEDMESARVRGRSTTRLLADGALRDAMVSGLRGWIDAPSRRGAILRTVEHPGWTVELVGAALGVVGFVFEGRPNVVADATGVLRSGNAVVFRIGSDALGTARALMALALEPARAESGLPAGAVSLIDSPTHAAGQALFCDSRLALAVARGSGPAVATLGALARQAGVPASLHGTGGAWLVAGERAEAEIFGAAVENSLDRKVCNTLNVCAIVRSRTADLVPVFLAAVGRAGERRGQAFRLHVVPGSEAALPGELFQREVGVRRASGYVREPQATLLGADELGSEWEWEETPECTFVVVDDVAHAVDLFNRYSPQFVASLASTDPAEHARFFATINAPFVGNGFTRWVDGQYALDEPELGLSNWQGGRLFARGGILSGDGVYTVRARVTQRDPGLRR